MVILISLLYCYFNLCITLEYLYILYSYIIKPTGKAPNSNPMTIEEGTINYCHLHEK